MQSYSGIQFNLSADSAETQAMWLAAVRKQIQFIENLKLKAKTSPREEMNDEDISVGE